MIQARLAPRVAAHWGRSYALVIDAASVMSVIAPIRTLDQIQHERAGKGMDLARDALDRGDLLIAREDIGLTSSGPDLVIRCGQFRAVRTDSLIPFWLVPDALFGDVARARGRVMVSQALELTPSIPSTMMSGERGSCGRRVGRAGLS
jgi:hypothetical protein